MPPTKDLAIVVRCFEWSETSQIVHLLSFEHGKVRGLAKGSKRSSPSSVARFSGGFELLTGGEFVGRIKPSGALATLTAWDLQNPHWHLRRDLRCLKLATYAADVAGRMVEDTQPHPEVYQAMDRFLAELADARESRVQAELLRFQWRLLVGCGYGPRVSLDAQTGQSLPDQPEYGFDAAAGGITAVSVPSHGGSASRGPWGVRRQTVRLLQRLEEDPQGWHGTSGQQPPEDPQAVRRANRLLCVFLRSLMDQPPTTIGYVLGES
jgi:DNA repair protein RecO (recombination protein O)